MPSAPTSRVELSAFGGLPRVRLLVSNAERRRAAKGTHVLVEGYREQQKPLEKPTTLGHPSLAWPAPDADQTGVVTLFAGGRRPITLGYFIRVRLDEEGALMRPVGEALPHYARQEDYDEATPAAWYLRLALAFGLDINDNRDKLPPVPNGYVVRVLVGADDGAARAFEIDIWWNGDGSLKPSDVLASALEHLHVREAS
jgi:hypothetical protein